MLDLRLTYRGNGQFETHWDRDRQECLQKLQQGQRVRAKVTRPRSKKHHRTFFGIIQKAWENQRPVENVPEFESAEDLRSYLLIQAGHCESWDLEPEACTRHMMHLLRRFGGYILFFQTREGIRAKRPLSVDYATLDQDDFNPVSRKVFEIIETDICPGVTIDQLKEQIGAHA